MNSTIEYIAQEDDKGQKLIWVVCNKMGISSRLLRKLKKSKNIFLNGRAVSVNASVATGDKVSIVMSLEKNIFDPEDLNVSIVFEDEDIMIVEKPPFMVVHPTKGHPFGTLGNGIAYVNQQRGQDYKLRFINRLDRDTSGLVMIAKNPFGQKVISEQMINNTVEKIYLAVVSGILEIKSGTIDAPIGKKEEDDVNRCVIDNGQPSVTHYQVIEEYKDATLLQLKLETGRTHQIRVHLQHIGHSILSDHLYGKPCEWIDRQALHAKSLTFKQVRTDEIITVVSPIPEDIELLIEKLK